MKSDVLDPTRGKVEMCESCQFRNFFDQSREAMFITSRDGAFVETNENFAALLGYTQEELAQMRVLDTLDSAEDRQAYQSKIEKEGAVHQYPLVLLRKDGRPILCVVDAIVWKVNGRIQGYHGIVRTKDELMASFRSYFNQLQEERMQIREERRNLVSDTQFLSRYTSDEMLEYIQETGKNPLAAGQKRVSILFFDIRNSTGLAENLSPDQFAHFLNDILTDIMDLVYGSKGSVNKLVGDGLMATFGAPLNSEEDQLNAVEAAMEINRYMQTFNDVRPVYLKDPVDAGIGIATGDVFTGVIGSVRRQEYAVLGDAVNIASRIQALTRKTNYKILMDEETWLAVENRFEGKKVFTGRIRGRQEALNVYGLECSHSNSN